MSPTASFTPEALTALKARHIAFLEARLTSEKAAIEWRKNLAAVYRDLLETPVRDLASASALADAADAVLSKSTVESLVRPIAQRLFTLTLVELRAVGAPASAYVEAKARQKIDELLERPGLFPDRLVREMAQQEAIEEVIRDMLYEALKEFSERVNPFVADWGLPALLKRLGPFGLGKGLESMRLDFEKRLDPEIRKFLQSASRRGLQRMTDFMIDKADEPKFIAARKRLFAWLLEQHIDTLARSADTEVFASGQEISLDVTGAVLEKAGHKARRRALLEEAIADHRDRTLGEVLKTLGVSFTPDFDTLAAATWPLVRAAFTWPTVRAFLETIVSEFYDGEIAALAFGQNERSSSD